MRHASSCTPRTSPAALAPRPARSRSQPSKTRSERTGFNVELTVGGPVMSPTCARTRSLCVFVIVLVLALGAGSALAGPCTGPGAPTTTQTKCLTAVQIPGNPLRSFDISFVNPDRAEYYLADRSNAGIDIIDTQHNTFKRRLTGFVGIVLNAMGN